MNTKAIDYDLCLEITSSAKIADEILEMLLKELPQYQKVISEAYEARDAKTIVTQAHKLHGACCYCGTVKLRDLIRYFENQANESPPLLEEAVYQAVMAEMDRVHQSLIAQDYK